MIGFWNREEVYCGMDIETFSRICTILTQNNIPYIHRMVNHAVNNAVNNGTLQLGTFGQNSRLQNMYYLYVHKNDYDQAIFLIRQQP